ncbi:hypothetical protein Peur_041574 [Populus x canadensis]
MYFLCKRLKLLKAPLKQLNKLHFRHISERVHKAEADLDQHQTLLQNDKDNEHLLAQDRQLRLDLVNLKSAEKMFYSQKLKCNFFKDCDRGTSFFHALMSHRHKKNFIPAIRCNSGSLTTSMAKVGDVFVSYYQQLLGSSRVTLPLDETVVCCGPRLDTATQASLLATVSHDDIKKALFSIGDHKSPGPDGYSSFFLKKSWDVVGQDLCVVVQDFFQSGQLLKQINHSIITLVPKSAHVTTANALLLPAAVLSFFPLCWKGLGLILSSVGGGWFPTLVLLLLYAGCSVPGFSCWDFVCLYWFLDVWFLALHEGCSCYLFMGSYSLYFIVHLKPYGFSMAAASSSKHLDVVLVEDCSDDEILDEDQLDFNFSDEECEDSPQAPSMLPAPHLSPPPPLLPAEQPPLLPKKVMSSAPISGSKELAPPSVAGNPIPAPSINKWRDLFSSNKSTNPCTKLQNFSLNHLSKTCTAFGRLGPQPPPPTVQGHPQDNNIQEAPEGIPQIFPPTVQGHLNSIQEALEDTTRPVAALDNSAGWVTVVSRKSSKQQKGKAVADSEPRKGKAVVVSAPELADNSPATPCPPVHTDSTQHSPRPDPLVATPCVGEDRGSSPTRIAPLVVAPCEGAAHTSSSRSTILAPTTGDTVGVGNSVKAPLLEVATQCGVRTRNQRQRGRSGRVSPSPAKL